MTLALPTPFYAKTRKSRELVMVDIDDVVYDQRGVNIGRSDTHCEDLHRGIPGKVLLTLGYDHLIALRGGRDKRAEVWHRWSSSGRDPRVLEAGGICAQRRAFMRGSFHAAPSALRPAGTYTVLIEKVAPKW